MSLLSSKDVETSDLEDQLETHFRISLGLNLPRTKLLILDTVGTQPYPSSPFRVFLLCSASAFRSLAKVCKRFQILKLVSSTIHMSYQFHPQ